MAHKQEFSGILLRQLPTPPFLTFPAYTPDLVFIFSIELFSTTLSMVTGSFPTSMKAAILLIQALLCFVIIILMIVMLLYFFLERERKNKMRLSDLWVFDHVFVFEE
jgi:uncharacterized BrkB/YihY/UPF0761 family membrane protein